MKIVSFNIYKTNNLKTTMGPMSPFSIETKKDFKIFDILTFDK